MVVMVAEVPYSTGGVRRQNTRALCAQVDEAVRVGGAHGQEGQCNHCNGFVLATRNRGYVR